MAFNVVCPNCGMTLSATDADVGKQGKCSRCQALFTITPPAPAAQLGTPPTVPPYGGGGTFDAHLRSAGLNAAADTVRLPAVGLIVTAVLGLSGNGWGVISGLVGGLQPLPPNIPPEFADFFRLLTGPVGVVLSVIGLLVAIFVLVGAIKMMNLRSYGLSMAATIVALVPCVSPCCCTGLPIGIWALVVLLRSDVQAAFRARV